LEAYTESKYFAVNVLADTQADLSENFASQREDKFCGVPFEQWESGCPILPGCVANLECTLVDTYDGGDHLILVGRVNRLQMSENGAPLLRYRGNYACLGEKS
jgi:flavin reductase (DIM6/NTAB) family NADH-FMN oxidoreductase RutF